MRGEREWRRGKGMIMTTSGVKPRGGDATTQVRQSEGE